MTRTLAALVLAVLCAHSSANAAQAEVSDSKIPTTDTTLNVPPRNNLETRTSETASVFEQVLPHLKAGWNSQNDAPRGSEQDGGKYTFLGKQEFYLGARVKSGWAVSLMYTTYQYSYSDASKPPGTQFVVGDPSVTVGFPTLYKNGSWSLNSQLRYYYPVSHYYVGRQIQNMAYYLFLNGELPGTNEFVNILIPRYFYEPNYHATDTNFYYEDRTQIAHRFSPWFRAGLGQWTQNEFHSKSADGFCMDIYPYADFIINKNLYFGPRYSFPVVASGSVFQGPQSVSFKEGFAELWLQASI